MICASASWSNDRWSLPITCPPLSARFSGTYPPEWYSRLKASKPSSRSSMTSPEISGLECGGGPGLAELVHHVGDVVEPSCHHREELAHLLHALLGERGGLPGAVPVPLRDAREEPRVALDSVEHARRPPLRRASARVRGRSPRYRRRRGAPGPRRGSRISSSWFHPRMPAMPGLAPKRRSPVKRTRPIRRQQTVRAVAGRVVDLKRRGRSR